MDVTGHEEYDALRVEAYQEDWRGEGYGILPPQFTLQHTVLRGVVKLE